MLDPKSDPNYRDGDAKTNVFGSYRANPAGTYDS